MESSFHSSIIICDDRFRCLSSMETCTALNIHKCSLKCTSHHMLVDANKYAEGSSCVVCFGRSVEAFFMAGTSSSSMSRAIHIWKSWIALETNLWRDLSSHDCYQKIKQPKDWEHQGKRSLEMARTWFVTDTRRDVRRIRWQSRATEELQRQLWGGLCSFHAD